MSEEPINPYYFYDNATIEYLREKMESKMREYQSYKKWTEQVMEEIHYIQKIIGSRVK